jgi:hypothetical protein
MKNETNLTILSGNLLLQVKLNKDSSEEQIKLKNSTFAQLQQELISDESKKCFWINIYNAYYQILAVQSAENTKNIYNRKEIFIAQTAFSLDEIEHGILRKFRWKWSFGYLPNPFAPNIIKQLALKEIDYRIHFALNCGAKSCPPIAFYTNENIDKQLDQATYSFLESETKIDSATKTVTTSKLLFWYQGDFQGKKGIRKLISRVFNLDVSGYKLQYAKYNWEMHLGNFK